ncbi:Uncharacterized protein JF76_05710 [Lactobacillus kullabergensis]|uniref:DUF2188 domain-containing protein n=1 Tax=Lactobacillus kullabergensis TaxID=1218493 RepID=A0A0F4LGY8_9LACO|nr:DUF2188 domain-containing protein [Lactobacillus kullabergensis]KJY57583.1 Uncharacterized protein JF76_05710 [Lactobacillus kullabergensis]
MGKVEVTKNVWVTTHGDKWAVKIAGSDKFSKTFDRKADALEYAKSLAQKKKTELISQKRNGRINLKNSYGRDSPKAAG